MFPAQKLHQISAKIGVFAVLASSDNGQTFEVVSISPLGEWKSEEAWLDLARDTIKFTSHFEEPSWAGRLGNMTARIARRSSRVIVVVSETDHPVGKSMCKEMERILDGIPN